MSLKAFDMHKCIFCPYKSIRSNLKRHLTSTGKKGVRCTALKNVISLEVWTNGILPHYSKNASMPDLREYKKQSPRKRKKLKALGSRKQMKNRTDEIFKSVCSAADDMEVTVPELLGLLLTRCTRKQKYTSIRPLPTPTRCKLDHLGSWGPKK